MFCKYGSKASPGQHLPDKGLETAAVCQYALEQKKKLELSASTLPFISCRTELRVSQAAAERGMGFSRCSYKEGDGYLTEDDGGELCSNLWVVQSKERMWKLP